MLEVEDIDVHYGKALALHDISFGFQGGQVIAIVGRNGAGKSTALKAIAGLLPLSKGKILLDGQDVSRLGASERNRLGIALVPEDRQIFPTLSVIENLKMSNVVKRNSSWSIDNIFDLFPRLRERQAAKGSVLSGGEQQMLAIGRAVLCAPKIMLLDEPTEGLAPIVIESLIVAIRKIVNTGVHIILVEQNMKVPTDLADYFYVMESGGIVWSGDKEHLAENQESVMRNIQGLNH